MTQTESLVPSLPVDGVWVPVPTFFTSTGLDIDAQTSHASFLEHNGIAGVVLLGSTGEAVHISREERNTIVSSVRSVCPSFPIMVGTASNSADETISLLVDAKEAGGNFGLVLAPGYFAPQVTQAGIINWYTAVADKSALPILVYHYPGVSNNVAILPDTVVQLSKHRNIVGAKFSHGDVSRHCQVSLSPQVDDNFRLYSGLGQQLSSVVLMGGAGVIDGLAATFPKTVVRLYRLSSTYPITKESVEEIRKLQYLVSKASELVCVKWGVVGIKECIHKIKGFGNKDGARLPIAGSVSDIGGNWGDVEDVITELKGVEKSLAT